MTTTTTIKDIEANETYKAVLRDSFGGIMYNVANRSKYDAREVLAMWDNLEHKDSVGGIMKGAMNFLQGK